MWKDRLCLTPHQPVVGRMLTLYGLIYENSKQSNNISQYDIGIKFSRVKTAYEDLSASAYAELFGRYSYFFKITKKTKSTFHFGPEIKLNYAVSFYPN
jgi:hypothetical protein